MKPLHSLARARVLIDGLDHPECVCRHPDGHFYVGGEAGQIYRIAADGSTCAEIDSTGGFILGVAVTPDGRHLLACDLKQHCLWRIELATGQRRLFARGVPGHDFATPNHLCFAPDGRLFVTESGEFGRASGKVICFEANLSGRGHIWHSGPFKFANGIAVAPDGQTVYVAASVLPGVEAVTVRADGSAGRRRRLLHLPHTVPDGVLVARDGTLYVTCYAPNRIYRWRNGRCRLLFDDWFAHTLSNPTNLCFADTRQRSLLVANLGRWHLTHLRLP